MLDAGCWRLEAGGEDRVQDEANIVPVFRAFLLRSDTKLRSLLSHSKAIVAKHPKSDLLDGFSRFLPASKSKLLHLLSLFDLQADLLITSFQI